MVLFMTLLEQKGAFLLASHRDSQQTARQRLSNSVDWELVLTYYHCLFEFIIHEGRQLD